MTGSHLLTNRRTSQLRNPPLQNLLSSFRLSKSQDCGQRRQSRPLRHLAEFGHKVCHVVKLVEAQPHNAPGHVSLNDSLVMFFIEEL